MSEEFSFKTLLYNSCLKVWLAIPLSFALLLSFNTLIPTDLHAQSEPAASVCVEGSVIDHEHNPGGAGWKIRAIPIIDGAEQLDLAIETETDGGGNFRFPALAPQRWAFEIELHDNAVPVTPAKFEVDISEPYSGCKRIRFKLRWLVRVDVLKIDQNHVPQRGWAITATPHSIHHKAKTATTNSDGVAVFNLEQGTWTFSEVAPHDIQSMPILPLTGQQELTVQHPRPL